MRFQFQGTSFATLKSHMASADADEGFLDVQISENGEHATLRVTGDGVNANSIINDSLMCPGPGCKNPA